MSNIKTIRGFTLVEMLVVLALTTMIALTVLTIATVNQKQYDIAQALAQLNQKEKLLRDLLNKTVDKAGSGLKENETPFVATLPRDTIDTNAKMVGQPLAVQYHRGNRCDGKPLVDNPPHYIDYLFVGKDSKGILSLRCLAPGKNIVSLLAGVDYMAVRYDKTDAQGASKQHNEETLGTTNAQWQNIKRISLYFVIATADNFYQITDKQTFDYRHFVNDGFDLSISFENDGRYRLASYHIIAPKWLHYQQ